MIRESLSEHFARIALGIPHKELELTGQEVLLRLAGNQGFALLGLKGGIGIPV